MREVSVRMVHFYRDLCRLAGVDEGAMTSGLSSVTAARETGADWVDWDDFTEVVERFERAAGGPHVVQRVMADAVPDAFPDVRAFAAIFATPIPLLQFLMTRMRAALYRNISVAKVELLAGDRVRWTQTIPEPYRPSEAFHRHTAAFTSTIPCHFGLPPATLEKASSTARHAELLFAFPSASALEVARAEGSPSVVAPFLAAQLDDAFSRIAGRLREGASEEGRARKEQAGEHPTGALAATGSVAASDWADHLALSPRQRGVFSLLVEGRANKDIAGVLQCSERNVEFHVGRILRAAGVTTRTELLVKVLRERP